MWCVCVRERGKTWREKKERHRVEKEGGIWTIAREERNREGEKEVHRVEKEGEDAHRENEREKKRSGSNS